MRRKDVRYMIEVPLLVELGKQRLELSTEDVSHGGVFFRTETPLPLQTLVNVEIVLPPRSQHFRATARVVHNVPSVSGIQQAGAGLEFYGIGSEVRKRWDSFVSHVREHYPESAERATILVTGEFVKPMVRRNAEHAHVLALHLRSLADLVTMLRRDLRERRLFVMTNVQAERGELIGLWVVHPHTEDIFELEGRVARRVSDGGLGGLALTLEGLTDERLARLEEFTYDAMEPLFDEEELGARSSPLPEVEER